MKKFFKYLVNFCACVMLGVSALSFSACGNIKTMEITLQIYNYTDSAFYAEEDVTMTVSLYGHLAPETVKYVTDLANSGYYDNVVFYKTEGYSSQINVGDLKFENGVLTQNVNKEGKLPESVYGEFESNGTTGSNLKNVKGSIGMWHGWYASADTATYKTSSTAMDSGRGTFYMPTSSISSYDGYFCVFATFDTEDTANTTAFNALSAVFGSSARYTDYVIYYTGEYDAAKATENYGLTFNVALKDTFEENYDEGEGTYNGVKVFEAEKDQLTEYNYKTVYIPNVVNGNVTAVIKSVKVK